jgi:hypothetical protein
MLPLVLFNRAVGFFASLQPEGHDQAPFRFPYDSTTPPILTIPPARWTALNASVGGRLFPGVPFAKPCFSRYEGWESGVEIEGCEDVRRGYGNECKLLVTRNGTLPCVNRVAFAASNTNKLSRRADQYPVGDLSSP